MSVNMKIYRRKFKKIRNRNDYNNKYLMLINLIIIIIILLILLFTTDKYI